MLNEGTKPVPPNARKQITKIVYWVIAVLLIGSGFYYLYQRSFQGFTETTVITFPSPAGEHPRVMFTADKVATLKTRVQKPAIAPYYQEMKTNAALITTDQEIKDTITALKSNPTYAQFGQNGGTVDPRLTSSRIEKLQKSLTNAAFVALIDGDANSIALAKDTFLAYLNTKWDPTPNWGNTSKPDMWRLSPSAALTYDWIYSHLSETERQQYRTWARSIVGLMHDLLLAETGGHGWANGFSPEVLVGAVGPYNGPARILTASFEGELGYDTIAEVTALNSTKTILAYLDRMKGLTPADSGSVHYSGVHYETLDQVFLAQAYDVMDLRGQNVWTHEGWPNIIKWWAYSMRPWANGEVPSFDDTPYGSMGSVATYLAAMNRFPANQTMRWVYQELTDHKSFFTPYNFFLELDKVLWAPETPPSGIDPTTLGLPNQFNLVKNGLVFAKTAWGNVNAVNLEFHSESRNCQIGHIHADRNSFNLQAYGSILFNEGGFGRKLQRDHNNIEIDGKGQAWPPACGRIANFSTTPSAWFSTSSTSNRDFFTVTGDAKKAYDYMVAKFNVSNWAGVTFPDLIDGVYSRSYNPVQKAFRTVDFVRQPNPYLVVHDDIKKDDTTRVYNSKFLLPTGFKLETLNQNSAYLRPLYNGQYVTSAGSNEMSVAFSVPTAGNYNVWLMAEKNYYDPANYGPRAFKFDGAAPKGVNGGGNNTSFALASADQAHFHYQKILNNPETLAAGNHTFNIGWMEPGVRIARLLFTTSTINPNFDTIPSDAVTVNLYDKTLPNGWTVGSAANRPSVLLYMSSSGTNKSGFQLNKFFHSADHENTYQMSANNDPAVLCQEISCIHQQLTYSVTSVEPKMRMFVYPYIPGMAVPSLVEEGTELVVTWPDGTIDRWGQVGTTVSPAPDPDPSPEPEPEPDPTPVDTIAPAVSITSPKTGITVKGSTLKVEVSATDNVGITKTELYVNGTRVATSTSSPFTMNWNHRKAPKGAHTLIVKAYDAAGNVGTSANVTVYK